MRCTGGFFSSSRATFFEFAEMRFLHFPNDPIEDKVVRHCFCSGAHRLRGRVCSSRARFCVEKHNSLDVSAQFRRDLFLLQALLSSVSVLVGLLHVWSSSDCPIKSGHRSRGRCAFYHSFYDTFCSFYMSMRASCGVLRILAVRVLAVEQSRSFFSLYIVYTCIYCVYIYMVYI